MDGKEAIKQLEDYVKTITTYQTGQFLQPTTSKPSVHDIITKPQATIAVVGESGVGKSAFISSVFQIVNEQPSMVESSEAGYREGTIVTHIYGLKSGLQNNINFINRRGEVDWGTMDFKMFDNLVSVGTFDGQVEPRVTDNNHEDRKEMLERSRRLGMARPHYQAQAFIFVFSAQMVNSWDSNGGAAAQKFMDKLAFAREYHPTIVVTHARCGLTNEQLIEVEQKLRRFTGETKIHFVELPVDHRVLKREKYNPDQVGMAIRILEPIIDSLRKADQHWPARDEARVQLTYRCHQLSEIVQDRCRKMGPVGFLIIFLAIFWPILLRYIWK